MMNKLIILGIDGLSYTFFKELANYPRFNGIRELFKNGHPSPMQTTVHPNTPVAWTTLFTGVNAGKHGIFDFRKIDWVKKEISFTNSMDIRVPMLWELFDNKGLSTGTINVPITHPATALRKGFMISGMQATSLEGSVSPESLVKQFYLDDCTYTVDSLWKWYDNEDYFITKTLEMAYKRGNVASLLLEKYKPDLFTLVFTATDRLKHLFWDKIDDPNSPVLRVYEIIDHHIERLLNYSQKFGYNLILISDHGFQGLEKDVYLNYFLRAGGFLRYQDDPDFISDSKTRRGFEFIDWKRTKAFSFGSYGNIYLNPQLSEKEKTGIIKNLKDKLLELNSSLEEGFVSSVTEREEIFKGPFKDDLPDLLIKFNNYKYITRDGDEFLDTALYGNPAVKFTGTHSEEALCCFYGKGFKTQIKPLIVKPEDITPIAHSLLGLDIPDLLDGSVPDLFVDKKRVRKIKVDPYDYYKKANTIEYTENKEELKNKLKSLGYMT